MAGLCTLYFLEQVDQLIGRDHLFKRSIILIKAWCYYESRTLGAHHGLISTYALEMLVLYVINIFHSSLHGPLEVLYRFLDYYSTFDWDKYCISLNGPVSINFLPEIVVETPENNASDLLLSKEFLKSRIEFFSVATRAFETKGQTFPIRHLNIMDPLKDNNNLGRSVSKGNFHRIRFAFSYGARKLREILMRPGKSMCEELKHFFAATLDRNGKGQRPDVEVPVPLFGAGRYEVSDLSGDCDSHFNGLQYGQWYHNYTLTIPVQPSPPTSPSLLQNKSAHMQFNRNIFSMRNKNDFVPRAFCHPNASQLVNASLGVEETVNSRGTGTFIPVASVEEKLKSRGTATYIPDIAVEDKMKSRGTGTFIPNIGVEEKLMLQGTDTYIRDTTVREKVKLQGTGTSRPHMGVEEKLLRGTGTYIPDTGVEENLTLRGNDKHIPKMGMEEKAQSQGPHTCISDVSIEANAKSRGTGTYSPDVAQRSYRQMDVLGRERNPEPKTQGFLLKSSLNIEEIEVSSEADEDGNSSCFNLSLEEFPLLPSSKAAIPSESYQSVQPTAESPQARKSSPCTKSIESGTLGFSSAPSIPSSPVASRQLDSDVDSMLGILTIATQGPQKSSEIDEETVLVQPYQLEDEEDFPPLCL